MGCMHSSRMSESRQATRKKTRIQSNKSFGTSYMRAWWPQIQRTTSCSSKIWMTCFSEKRLCFLNWNLKVKGIMHWESARQSSKRNQSPLKTPKTLSKGTNQQTIFKPKETQQRNNRIALLRKIETNLTQVSINMALIAKRTSKIQMTQP